MRVILKKTSPIGPVPICAGSKTITDQDNAVAHDTNFHQMHCRSNRIYGGFRKGFADRTSVLKIIPEKILSGYPVDPTKITSANGKIH
jgi:hypothetical protein